MIDHDVFTKRGITPPWKPGGEVARLQGFERYGGPGADWQSRRADISKVEPLYASDEHPDHRLASKIRARNWERTLENLKKGYRARRRVDGRDTHVNIPADPGAARELLRLEEAIGKGRWPLALPENGIARRLYRLERDLQPEFVTGEYGEMRMVGGRETRKRWLNWLRHALAVDGWIMPRYAVMPDARESDFSDGVVAQLRPDMPVFMGPKFKHHDHWHEFRWNFKARRDHEAKVCDPAPAPGQPGHEYAIEHPDGAFLPTGHLHPKTGKLVVPIKDRAGKNVWHAHLDWAKYLYTPGDTAKRLGTNPLVLERGYGAEAWPDSNGLFVFVMEGTFKMCAVVEAGYPAIDAGSVNLWHGGREIGDFDEDGDLVGTEMLMELTVFAERHLVGRPVAVVCDSDWNRNDQVKAQTEMVVGVLNGAGALAVACAPPEGKPLGWSHPVRGEIREKLGVDDWLGGSDPWLDEQYGPPRRDLLDLVFPEVEGPATLTEDDPRLDGHGFYRPGRKATADLLRRMGLEANRANVAPYREQEWIEEGIRSSRTRLKADLDRGVKAGLAHRAKDHEHVRGDDGTWVTIPPEYRLAEEAVERRRDVTLREWLARQRGA